MKKNPHEQTQIARVYQMELRSAYNVLINKLYGAYMRTGIHVSPIFYFFIFIYIPLLCGERSCWLYAYKYFRSNTRTTDGAHAHRNLEFFQIYNLMLSQKKKKTWMFHNLVSVCVRVFVFAYALGKMQKISHTLSEDLIYDRMNELVVVDLTVLFQLRLGALFVCSLNYKN